MGGCRLIDFMAEFWLFYLFSYCYRGRSNKEELQKPEFHANLETFNDWIEMIKSRG